MRESEMRSVLLPVFVYGLGGIVLPGLGWLIGAMLVSRSTAWTRSEKLAAFLGPLAAVTLGALLEYLTSGEGVFSFVGLPHRHPALDFSPYSQAALSTTGWMVGNSIRLYRVAARRPRAAGLEAIALAS